MHQEDLWRASARATAYTFKYETADSRLDDHGLVSVRVDWSKRPSALDGCTSFEAETYTEWHLHDVFKASFHQFLAGQAGYAGRHARSAYRDVQTGFVLGTHG